MARKLIRIFRGIPVQEARASLHVQPNKADISGAVKEDPANCAYARCLKRTLEAGNVFVFKTVAYIQTMNESGAPIMERYRVRKYAREYITRFDSGKVVEPGGFVFHKPNRSCTLDYKVKDYARRKKLGKLSPRRSSGPPATRAKAYSVRNGKGRVHFLGSQDIIPAMTEAE